MYAVVTTKKDDQLDAMGFVDSLLVITGNGKYVTQIDSEPPDELNSVVPLMASLMVDVERRAGFQLAWLRRFPLIDTPCCGEPMCFKVSE